MKRQILFAFAIVVFCFFAALYSTQARSTKGINLTQGTSSSPADLSEKLRLLSSPDPVERATAACQIGAMGKSAAQAIPHLIQMLGDDTKITGGIFCNGNGKGRHFGGEEDATTPGKVAAGALAAIGA